MTTGTRSDQHQNCLFWSLLDYSCQRLQAYRRERGRPPIKKKRQALFTFSVLCCNQGSVNILAAYKPDFLTSSCLQNLRMSISIKARARMWGALKHIYKRPCLSVHPSVCQSVRHASSWELTRCSCWSHFHWWLIINNKLVKLISSCDSINY